MVIDQLSDPMVFSHWILIDQLLHSLCNWWTGCLLIFVWSYVYICMQIVRVILSMDLLWLDKSLWPLLLVWLDKHMTVPICFITYGWTNIVYWTIRLLFVLTKLLNQNISLVKSLMNQISSTKSVKNFWTRLLDSGYVLNSFWRMKMCQNVWTYCSKCLDLCFPNDWTLISPK